MRARTQSALHMSLQELEKHAKHAHETRKNAPCCVHCLLCALLRVHACSWREVQALSAHVYVECVALNSPAQGKGKGLIINSKLGKGLNSRATYMHHQPAVVKGSNQQPGTTSTDQPQPKQ